MSANPFTLSFGKKPLQYISRLTETNQILENFCAENPSNQIYMITGVRGSGKTVMMTSIASELRKMDNWIVVELNPARDLLQSLAAKIYSIPELHALFVNEKLDFSAFGLGISIENAAPVTDIENALELMLKHIQKIVTEMSLSGETKVKALRERLDMKSELFSVYRERLKKKGVILSKEYGKVTLALPRFEEFVKIQQLM